uniref:Ferritin n=1 Tax=Equus caballus TaxID=9796 RepID=A0A9L0RFX1_HORSE
MMTTQLSQVHQHYHLDCEAAVSIQMNLELYASYVYLSVGYYFDGDDVALKPFCHFFLQLSCEEREHAHRLTQLQNLHGGRLCLRLHNIGNPDQDDWESGLEVMKCTLHLEKCISQSLLDLYQLATDKNDAHLCDFLANHHLKEQVKSMKELGGHITNPHKMGAPEDGMAEYLFDKLTLGDGNKN